MARGSDDKQTGLIYLRIAGGKIVETVEPDTFGAVMRMTKPTEEYPNGREVWERRDGYVDGVITSMYHKDKEYKGETVAELHVRLSDGAERYCLQVNKGNRYWVGIMMRLPNINFQRSVRFSPYDFEGKDEATGGKKQVVGINLFQNGVKIAPAWTKDQPGDLPLGRKVRVNGKDVWDFEERDAYLMRVFLELQNQLEIGDQVLGGDVPPDIKPTLTSAPAKQDEDDDLPF